jgi:Site-specific recombinase XerD
MANLYRKPVVLTDPVTGEKVKTQSKKWWGQFRDANGRLHRHPLAVDKLAAQAMLNELVRQVEREKAGLVDPTDRQRRRPLEEHIAEFRAYLKNKAVTPKQVGESVRQIEKLAVGRKWKSIADITASSALEFLGDLRRRGRSAQTYNHYLKSAKQFTRWLVSDRRTPSDPLAHVARLNVATDRRHDRRALTMDELTCLIEAAKSGMKVEKLSGRDRAMLYVLAAWTGFRKGELGSLTPSSLRLDDDPPTATVAASYSKRRREDTQVLHPDIVVQLREWLKTKPRLKSDSLLFPIAGRVPGGADRKTHKMMVKDLAVARKKWIKEGKTRDERTEREESDFLAHCNHAGLYADFHSLRHFFITSLERSGASPRMAQTLARHSDIRLTLGVYTHVSRHDQTAVIQGLPGPANPAGVTQNQPSPAIRVAS